VHQSTSDWALTALDCSLAEVTAPAPVNAYGETKLRFEEEIRAGWDNHLILRSSLIYGPPPPVKACTLQHFRPNRRPAVGGGRLARMIASAKPGSVDLGSVNAHGRGHFFSSLMRH
jgi:nucleoside-diphosphate-sugar epimerase